MSFISCCSLSMSKNIISRMPRVQTLEVQHWRLFHSLSTKRNISDQVVLGIVCLLFIISRLSCVHSSSDNSCASSWTAYISLSAQIPHSVHQVEGSTAQDIDQLRKDVVVRSYNVKCSVHSEVPASSCRSINGWLHLVSTFPHLTRVYKTVVKEVIATA